ncbi:hypothetical protein AVEN_147431-1 [Araneus ventricosus]|uniref:Uncharacterized protein n=1 Tax=Araneus ventricosus TaxID=182803 RepID=A0A4Y2DND4_ARAVE|nr:hypothetical protein AVEN_147431-1 [Araneus ventricosus]
MIAFRHGRFVGQISAEKARCSEPYTADEPVQTLRVKAPWLTQIHLLRNPQPRRVQKFQLPLSCSRNNWFVQEATTFHSLPCQGSYHSTVSIRVHSFAVIPRIVSFFLFQVLSFSS